MSHVGWYELTPNSESEHPAQQSKCPRCHPSSARNNRPPTEDSLLVHRSVSTCNGVQEVAEVMRPQVNQASLSEQWPNMATNSSNVRRHRTGLLPVHALSQI